MMKTRLFTRSRRERPGASNSSDSGMITTSSERSALFTDSERTGDNNDDIDIDFSVTESGRTVAHLVLNNEGFGGGADDGLDFSITSSGRTIDHIMQDQMQSGSLPTSASGGNNNNNATIVPAVTVKASNPLIIPIPPTTTTAKSPARAIPQPKQQPNSATSSHPGSQESSGSSFLSGILNPSATTFNNNQLSHTPPTALGTSYENSHFGKRQRSGSVSGRLRSASDLEEKGLIDRQQKGILKDLIICGDEELQHALDQYEDGNPSILEHMIRSGALQNKAVPDLDLLGDLDLDLDFLTVHDIGDHTDLGDDAGGKNAVGMHTLPQEQQQHQQHYHQHQQYEQHHPHDQQQYQQEQSQPMALHRSASMPSAKPSNSFAAKQHRATQSSTGMVSPEFDDGIGELEFTGDFDGSEGDYYGSETTNDSHHHHHPQHPPMNVPGKQQRGPSPPIAEDIRLRSNSLFSALITEPRSSESHDLQYGRWMDRDPHELMGTIEHPKMTFSEQVADHTDTTSASQPIPIPKNDTEDNIPPDASLKKKKGRRKSDSAVLERMLKAKRKEELQEQKRREKQEKKAQREQEKQQKKEARLQAKAEKKKQKEQKKEAAAMVVEEEEKPVHIPGSGRPRSMSDPNLRTTRDEFGLMEVERPEGWVGAYSPESRKVRIEKFLAKRHQRVWTKTVKYDVRKNFADSRLRVKGRFVKKEDETLMRELMSLT